MWARLLHDLNAKCLSEKRVGQRRLQTAVRAIYEGDLALAVRSNVWDEGTCQ
jgi:hypothetical protein